MSQRLAKKTLDGNMETLLLAVLSDGPSYGYAIVQELNRRGNGLLKMGEGTVYPVLYRLEERGLVRSQWRKGDNGRERKYYRNTPAGIRALAENRQQWQGLMQLMNRMLEGGGEADAAAPGAPLKPQGGTA